MKYEVYLGLREIHAGMLLAGDSLTKLAQRLGYNPMTAHRVARGISQTPRIREEIARVLGRPVDEIFGGPIKDEPKTRKAREDAFKTNNYPLAMVIALDCGLDIDHLIPDGAMSGGLK